MDRMEEPLKVVVPWLAGATDRESVIEWVDLALRQQQIYPRYVELKGPNDYHALLRELWAEGDTFAIVEHDIIVWPGAVHALWECEQPWCFYGYLLSGRYDLPALGCVKFDARLMEAMPHLIESFEEPHWKHQDSQVLAGLAVEFSAHQHYPHVNHLRKRQLTWSKEHVANMLAGLK